MSMGSWLKAHKKQVITHTSIIMGFVLFTIFVAEPLFDRLEKIPGEAQLHQFQLPAETNDIRYAIGFISTEAHSTVEIGGWAFIDGHDSVNSEIYIVLKSANRTYIFETMVTIRADVTRHFKELSLNLDYSGFAALIPAREIENGTYTIGIYVRKAEVEALQYLNKTVVK